MAKKKQSYLRPCLLRVTRAHFWLVLILVASIIVFDGWNYITLENAFRRWTITAVLFVVTTVVWYASRDKDRSPGYYKSLLLLLVLADIALATTFVYNDRGIASPGVILYVIPIITSSIAYARRAIFAVAALCTASYTLASVRYFVANFNEAITVQLYGTAALYSAAFFLLAALLWVVLSPYEVTD